MSICLENTDCLKFPLECAVVDGFSRTLKLAEVLRGLDKNGNVRLLHSNSTVKIKYLIRDLNTSQLMLLFFTHDLPRYDYSFLAEFTFMGIRKWWKVRLINRDIKESYIGVNHSYISIEIEILERLDEVSLNEFNKKIGEING